MSLMQARFEHVHTGMNRWTEGEINRPQNKHDSCLHPYFNLQYYKSVPRTQKPREYPVLCQHGKLCNHSNNWESSTLKLPMREDDSCELCDCALHDVRLLSCFLEIHCHLPGSGQSRCVKLAHGQYFLKFFVVAVQRTVCSAVCTSWVSACK